MLEKQIISVIDATSTKSDFLLVDDSFEKTASVDTDPVIAEFVQKLTKQQNVIYALINALTASDYISSNLNGDWISEDVLKNYYKTFEENGHVYFHHVNKDPNKAVGRVIFSHYNPKMHRVELVVKIFTDRPDSANLIKRINSNDYIATSMGLKTSYDVCSICNKKSKTRAEYCEHLKTQMNSILPDGRKVFANNPEAKFFDISIVRVPADPTSAIMKILTNLSDSKEIAQPSENIFDNLFKVSYIKEANLKSAELKKFISTKLEVVQTSENPEKLLNSQGKLNNDVIEKLSEYSISDILSTFLGLRILPTPQDFQKIALFSSGEKELALKLESENSVFDYKTVPDEVLVSSEVDLNKFSYNIYEILQDDIHDHTWVKEAAIARELVKVAEDALRPGEIKEPSMIRKLLFSTEQEPKISPVQNPIMPLGILGSLYYGYIKVFNDSSQSSFRNFMLKNPWLLPVLIGGAAYSSVKQQEADLFKTAGAIDKFLLSSLISFPVSYYNAGKIQNKANNNEEITSTENFVRKHPALLGITGGIAGAAIANKTQKVLTKLSSILEELNTNHKQKLYSELFNGG